MKKVLVLEAKDTFYKFINKDTDSDFEFVFIDNIHIAKYKYINIIEKLKNYNGICSIHYNDYWFNLILFEAKRIGLKTFLLMDGPLEWMNTYHNHKLKDLILCRPVIHDYIFAISKDQAKILKKWNPNKKIYTYRNYRIVKKIKVKIDTDTQYDFLITTANTAYFNDGEFERLVFLINEIVREVIDLGYSLKFRIFDKRLQESITDFDKYENNIIESIEEAISSSKSIITTPSSIAIESIYYTKPTALLVYRDSPLFYQTGWNLSLSVDIKETLRSMINSDKNRMEYQLNYIENNLSKQEFQDILSKVLNQKLEHKVVSYDELNFENKIYKNLLESKFNFNFICFYTKIRKSILVKKIIDYIKDRK